MQVHDVPAGVRVSYGQGQTMGYCLFVIHSGDVISGTPSLAVTAAPLPGSVVTCAAGNRGPAALPGPEAAQGG